MDTSENLTTTPETKAPLQFLQPRDSERRRRAAAASVRQRIARLRIVLPLIGLTLLILLLLWPVIRDVRFHASSSGIVPDLVVDNLHFTGVDTKDEPYVLMSKQATRVGGTPGLYDLVRPEAEITLQNGAWLSGRADFGRLQNDQHKLWLGGNVQLYHDKGYQFTSDEAQVDLANNEAWGEKPVLIQGSFGIVRGVGFRFFDGGAIMVVKGPAHAILNLHTMAASDTSKSDHQEARPAGRP